MKNFILTELNSEEKIQKASKIFENEINRIWRQTVITPIQNKFNGEKQQTTKQFPIQYQFQLETNNPGVPLMFSKPGIIRTFRILEKEIMNIIIDTAKTQETIDYEHIHDDRIANLNNIRTMKGQCDIAEINISASIEEKHDRRYVTMIATTQIDLNC